MSSFWGRGVKNPYKNPKPMLSVVEASQIQNYSCRLTPDPLPSRLSNHLIRPCQHIRWNRQANLLCGLQIDHKLKLGRLFDR